MSAATIVECLYSFQIGGSERLGALLAREFASRGHPVAVASFFDVDGPIRVELERAGVACHGFDVLRRTYVGRMLLPRDVRRWLRDVAPDVVHMHHGVTAIRAAREARACGVRRLVLTEHSSRQLRAQARYRRALRRVLPSLDIVTAVNAELCEYFATDLGVPRMRVVGIANAVDPAYALLERDDAERSRRGLDGAFVFAFVGRLVPEKSIDVLVDALRRARDSCGRDLRLVVAGDGPLRDDLRARAREHRVDHAIAWLGARPDPREALALADAFVMSSSSEGMPMALIEAMTAGLPCVATSVGGIPTALADEAGLLVPPLQPALLATAMTRVATDPRLSAALGRRARAVALRDHSLARIADDYLDAFGLSRGARAS